MPNTDAPGDGDGEEETVSTTMDASARLHPLTVVKELGALAWAIIGALVLPVELPFLPDEVLDPDTFLAVAVLGYAVLRYLVTRYTVSPEVLELRKGVFVKRVQTMPRDRIQTVDVRIDILGRLFGVSTVSVSAADTEQIEVSYVSHAQADRLRRLLEPPSSDFTTSATDDQRLVPGLPRQTLFVLTVASWLLFTITETAFPLAVLGLGLLIGLALFNGVSSVVLGILPVVAIPFFAATTMVGFRSWLQGNRLGVVRGLLSRRETTTPLPRIQALLVSRPLLRRALGHETVGVVSGDVTGSVEEAGGFRIMAPLAALDSWPQLAMAIGLDIGLHEGALRRSSPLTIRRSVIRGLSVVVVLTALLGVVTWGLGVNVAWAFTVLPLGIGLSLVYARLRYRALGWVTDDRHVLIRKGVLTRVLMAVPIHKIQDVTVQATYFQRRLGIATVDIDTAGGTMGQRIRAVDLPRGQADNLAVHLARGAARVWLPDGV